MATTGDVKPAAVEEAAQRIDFQQRLRGQITDGLDAVNLLARVCWIREANGIIESCSG